MGDRDQDTNQGFQSGSGSSERQPPQHRQGASGYNRHRQNRRGDNHWYNGNNHRSYPTQRNGTTYYSSAPPSSYHHQSFGRGEGQAQGQGQPYSTDEHYDQYDPYTNTNNYQPPFSVAAADNRRFDGDVIQPEGPDASDHRYDWVVQPEGAAIDGDGHPNLLRLLTGQRPTTSPQTTSKVKSYSWRSGNSNTMDYFEAPKHLEKATDEPLIKSSKPARRKLELKAPTPPGEFKNQRDALSDQLSRNDYECMVCCAKLTRRQQIWTCGNCFNIFHLTCVKKWVTSSAIEGSWRCPGCQNVADYFPDTYTCFCGKTKDPSVNHDIPHTCNLVCSKVKSGGLDCTHTCNLQCHPGPCPPCTDLVTRKCECGKKAAFVQCSSKNAVVCGSKCEKALNCGIHYCTANCHAGPCEDCTEKLVIVCHCKRNKKEVTCTPEFNSQNNPSYSCHQACNSLLNCRNHKCLDLCHPDACTPCPTSTSVVISCPCGQTPIGEACSIKNLPPRKSCLDSIPTCGKPCRKILTCGPPGKNHQCQEKCHTETPCPPCLLTTELRCRCGNQEKDIPCTELLSSGDYLCERKCTKKRSCGRHKCNTKCCIDTDHICPVVCDKTLSCGNHRCESLCHIGHCHPCRNVSFEELRCECGTAVIYPPVPCGTKPPPCIKPCTREHPCDHPVVHNCHSDPTCPPCSYLTEKWCYGNHELRKNVLCHVTNVSCGIACQKLLRCGRHKCPRVCHAGACQRPDDVCKLLCLKRRKICGHNCATPCHEDPCPDVKCKELTEATCTCGRRKEGMVCWKREIEFDRGVAAAVSVALNALFLEDKKTNTGNDEGGDKAEPSVEDLTASIRKEKSKIQVLDCDKECARVERNRRMAAALQLENPDVETRLGPPNYTDFCKKFAQKYPQFVEMVHTKMTDVVMQAKRSKKVNLTYEFDSMNRDKRQLIHEYSDHFGCQSESFDEEPNRNVIVTASKEKSYLPSVSLIDTVFRQTTLKTDRKNVHQDLELVEPTKTQIIGPANRKLVMKTGSKMVFLNGGSS